MSRDFPNVPIVGTASGGRSTPVLNKRLSLANPSVHLQRFPKARTSTISHLIEREKMTATLRKEVEARKPWYARVLSRLRVMHGSR